MSEPKPMPVERPPLHVRDVPERSRYEVTVGADPALAGLLDYRRSDRTIWLLHTEVLEGHEGRGIGSGLVRGVFDDARGRGLKVVARCPFVVRWLERHQEETDIVIEAKDTSTPSEPEPA